MSETTRYSDKRLAESFTVYVLFSEPLRASVQEVMEAVAEDYPGLDWSWNSIGSDDLDTRDVKIATDLASSENPTRGLTSITTLPGRCALDWDPVFEKSWFVFPDAKAAVARHTDYLSISVGSPRGDTSLAARFDAARRVTCLGAVFAKLPIALGVYFPSADLILKPDTWAEAAETAMKGEVPVLQWMAIYANPYQWDGPEPRPCTVGTIGMAAFNGHELVMPQVRLEPKDAAHWVYMTARMLLETDHEFTDSDTLGVEKGDKPIRIRHLREGQQEMQTDTWMLFHKTSLLDDIEVCGKRSRRPAPPGADNSYMGNWDTLKNRLYGWVASGDG